MKTLNARHAATPSCDHVILSSTLSKHVFPRAKRAVHAVHRSAGGSNLLTLPDQAFATTSASPESATDFQQKQSEEDVRQFEKIESTLSDWGTRPETFEEYGDTAPSRERLSLALKCLYQIRNTPPTSVTTDPNGTIIFGWKVGAMEWSLYFWDNGEVELLTFQGTKVVEREVLT